MRSETLKTMGVSIGSSLFTMVLVLACSAGAGKLGADDSSDPGDNQDEGEDLDEEDDDQNGSGGDDGDDGDGGLASLISDVAEMAATIAAQQASIVELELFKSSSLCFIGHMTDDRTWRGGEWNYGDEYTWRQGPDSDAQMAYDDCF